MDMSKVNMHKRVAMTGNAPDVPAKAGHFRGGGIAKRGKGKALQAGGVFSDTVGRALGRRTPDAEGRALRKGGRVNTRRENILEEKGRVDAEKAYTKGGKERLGAEQRRLAHELGKKEGGFLARRKKLAGFGAVRIAAKLLKKSKKRKK